MLLLVGFGNAIMVPHCHVRVMADGLLQLFYFEEFVTTLGDAPWSEISRWWRDATLQLMAKVN